MTSVDEMFAAMFAKAVILDGELTQNKPLVLTVATVCSGTEAPLIALNLINEACLGFFGTDFLEYHHQFSCEIEPFKQAFIRRNHDPPVIFRNVVELGAEGAQEA